MTNRIPRPGTRTDHLTPLSFRRRAATRGIGGGVTSDAAAAEAIGRALRGRNSAGRVVWDQGGFNPAVFLDLPTTRIDTAGVDLYNWHGIRRDPLIGGGVAEWLKAAVC
jgi:hypothetical protein